MPNQKPDAEAALRKLGQKLRELHLTKYPATDKDLEAVRKIVLEQCDQEQKVERAKPVEPPIPAKDKKRERDEPEPEP